MCGLPVGLTPESNIFLIIFIVYQSYKIKSLTWILLFHYFTFLYENGKFIVGGIDMDSLIVDAPEALGLLFMKAVKEKNVAFMNNLLEQGWLFGKWTAQLDEEDRIWASHNVNRDVEVFLDE